MGSIIPKEKYYIDFYYFYIYIPIAKTKINIMKKFKPILVILITLILFSSVTAQTPQYFNYNNVGTSSNTFPFAQNAGKAVQWLFLAGDLNQPAPLPPGYQITKVWFFITTGGTRTFTDLRVLLAQDTIITLSNTAFYPGPWDTVYYRASVSLTASSTSWMPIELDKPFVYDPNKSLIMMVGQCASSGSAGLYVRQNVLTPYRRNWSVGGCPFVISSGDGSVLNFGVDVVPSPIFIPTVLYYKFENNPSLTSVLNCANPGAGTQIAPIANVTLTPNGQFDSCITGTGLTSSGVTTGWNCNFGTSSWTISMWVEIPTSTSGSAFYLFGDIGSGSFRCFHNGLAYPDSMIIRGTGITDMIIPGTGPAPTHVAFVYDSATATMYGYKNGVLVRTRVQAAPLNMATGTGFRVGGYSTLASFIGKLDEFRVYRRALSAAEIAASWNMDIACGIVTGMSKNIPLPESYMLCQNYPNPFNPTTKIGFAIPRAGFVTLKVYDILGKEVATLVNEMKTAGNYIFEFDASNLSTGVYFYTLNVNGFTDTKKMLFIK